MKVEAFEGIVDHGRIRLTSDVRLPEKTMVFVVVPETRKVKLSSPRLAHPEQMPYFKKEIVEDSPDADL
jgi:hypothetical protein